MVPEGKHRLGEYFAASKEKGAEGLPTLSVTLRDGLVNRDVIDRKMDTELPPEKHLRVRPGYIAYNMMRMWQGASGLAKEEAIVSPAYVVLESKDNVDPVFASYLFKERRMIHLFWAYSYGLTSDRLRLYFNDFKRIPAQLPPLPEQKKIAEILSTWDRAIEVAERQFENARLQKKALMQQLLTGTRRLPGFDGPDFKAFSSREKYTPSDIGPTPADWKDPYLRGVTSFISNGFVGTATPFYSEQEMEGAVKYLYGTNIRENRIDGSGLRFVNPEFHKSQEKTSLKSGDLLVVQSGHIGTTAVVTNEYEGSNCHALIIVRLDKSKLIPEFCSQYLNSEIGKARLRGLEVGSTIKHINTKDLKKFRFPMPTLDEQRAISAILINRDREIEMISKKVAYLRTEKRALMQQLLTGKKRVTI